jgi:hypothetical protein
METLLETEGLPISATLISQRMAEVLTDRFDPREFRLSESGGCPRRRVAKVLGIPGDEFDETDAAYFERGNILEEWVVSLFRAEFPRRCHYQEEVRTAGGEVGHIDIGLPAERRLVEVKSVSIGAKDLPRREHVRQVQSYLHFCADAKGRRKYDSAELFYVRWGAGIDTEAHVVAYDPAAGRDIENELAALHGYRDRGTMPPIPVGHKPESYPCSWRNRAGVVKCSHWLLCWANVAAIPPLDAPEVADDVARLAELTGKWDATKRTAEDLEGAVKVIRQRLGAVLSAHGARQLAAAGYVVTRSPVAGRKDYDVAAAIQAGAVGEAVMAPYVKVGAGYDRWNVKRVGTPAATTKAAG